jgi:hypothetical protein
MPILKASRCDRSVSKGMTDKMNSGLNKTLGTGPFQKNRSGASAERRILRKQKAALCREAATLKIIPGSSPAQ